MTSLMVWVVQCVTGDDITDGVVVQCVTGDDIIDGVGGSVCNR